MNLRLTFLIIFLSFFSGVFAQVLADAGPDREICLYDTLKVRGAGLNTGDTGNYVWKDLSTGIVISNSEDFTLIVQTTGTRFFELMVSRTSIGVTYIDKDSFLLKVNTLPVLQIDLPDTVCSSQTPFTLSNIQPPGAVGSWSGKGVIGRMFNPGFAGTNSKQYEGPFMVTFTYNNPLTGCSASDSQSLLIQAQPEVLMSDPNPYQQCEDKVFTLHAQPKWAFKTLWSTNGDGSFANAGLPSSIYYKGFKDTAMSGLAGNVILTISTVKEGVCPTAKGQITLLMEPYPVFTMPRHTVACEPAIINLSTSVSKPSGSPNLKYTWWLGNGDTLRRSNLPSAKNIRYDSAKPGWYDITLIVHNQWGASSAQSCDIRVDSSDYIRVLPQPTAAFRSIPEYYTTKNFPEFEFFNTTRIRWGHDSIKYLWNFDQNKSNDTSTKTNPKHRYQNDTAYYWVRLQATYHYLDKTTNNDYYCWDSTSQPRVIGPSIDCIKLYTVTQNKLIRLRFGFDGDIKYIDANGQIMEKHRVSGQYTEDIDISSWASGVYFFELREGSRKCILSFIQLK